MVKRVGDRVPHWLFGETVIQRQAALSQTIFSGPAFVEPAKTIRHAPGNKAYNGGFVEKHIEVLFGVGGYDCISQLYVGLKPDVTYVKLRGTYLQAEVGDL